MPDTRDIEGCKSDTISAFAKLRNSKITSFRETFLITTVRTEVPLLGSLMVPTTVAQNL